MRCRICDVSDVGLSDFRPDGKNHARHFFQTSQGCECEECYDGSEEILQDWYEDDLEDEENENENV